MTKDYKDLVTLNIEDIEPLDVTESEKRRVKQYVLGAKSKRKSSMLYRHIAVAAIITIGVVTSTGFAFPTVAFSNPFYEKCDQLFSR